MEQLIGEAPQGYVGEEGMIFVRIINTLRIMARAPLLVVCFVLLTISSLPNYTFGISRVLDFTIYTDGTIHVFYSTDVDPMEPEFSTSFYGQNIDNLLAQDENGILLSAQIVGKKIVVETLGASLVKIDYETADLVTKNGKIWSFSINSPQEYSILLPKNTVIVGMNAFPLNMQVVDDQSLISLPDGKAEIDYVFGVLGTAQTATLAIEKAKDFIETINSEKIETPLAQAKLDEATALFKENKFSSAEILANEAKNIASQEQQDALLKNGNNSDGNSSNNQFTAITIVIGIAVGAAVGVLILKRRKSPLKNSSQIQSSFETTLPVDTETVFRLKPELRQEDKDMVTFISENGGQVYESDLRKKFLLPRTTTWRAVKRLEREGIIEIEKIDQQNLIKLRKTLEEDKE